MRRRRLPSSGIHGISTHPDYTWYKEVGVGPLGGHNVNWLEDRHMLLKEAEMARIIKYRCESQWFGKGTISQKVSTVAQRLLLNVKRVRKVY